MGAGSIGTPRKGVEGVSHEGGRLIAEHDGQGGISDKRRAELERLEAEAGAAVDASSANDRPRHPTPVDRGTMPGQASGPGK